MLYHEVAADSFASVARSGLRQGERGQKSDARIAAADNYLDACIPAQLRAAGVSRCDNIYAFIGDDATIIDIQDGVRRRLDDYARQHNDTRVVRLVVDARSCYVSDLDRYDAVKVALERGDPAAPTLARDYWRTIMPLPSSLSVAKHIQRPEVMITCHIPAGCLASLPGN